MEIKGLFKNSSFSSQFVISCSVFLLANIIISIPFMLVMSQDAAFIRMMLFVSQLGTFVFSSFFLAYLFSDAPMSYLRIKTGISWKVILWVILSMLVALPFLNLTIQINEAMKLPEWLKPLEDWMIAAEKQAREVTDSILISKSWFDLILNLIVVALTAAVGEELFFRGVLQNVLGKKLQNKHVIIWIVAILFSAFHFQFYGFIPRMLMGAYFGYLLYYTRSIWAPILAHLTNNAFAVLATYKYQDTSGQNELDAVGTGSEWWIALISLIFWAYFFYRIIKAYSPNKKTIPTDSL